MRTDSNNQSAEHISFENQFYSPSILLYGFTGLLKKVITERYKNANCLIYQNISDVAGKKLTYIFHHDNLKNISKTLFLAHKNNAKFIFVSTKNSQKIDLKAKEIIKQLKAKTSVFQFSCVEPKGKEEANEIVDLIFRKIFMENKQVKKTHPKKSIQTAIITKKPLTPPAYYFILFTVIFGLFITYLSVITGAFVYGYRNLNESIRDLSQGELETAAKKGNKANELFTFGGKLLSLSLPILNTISKNETISITEGLKASQLFTKTTTQIIFVARMSQNTAEAVVSGRTALQLSQIDNLQTEIKKLNDNMNLLLAEIKYLQQIDSKIFHYLQIVEKLAKAEDKLNRINQLFSLSSQFSSILPDILGYNEPKTFLILFQNNSELRPTGGFIGSFGWLTFSQGKLMEFRTEDVYTADGQLKGHVAPPLPLRKYLLSENWYLRDSNFDPDFTASAQQAEWFLKHEMDLSFDGVLAIDLNGVQELLRAIDGVYLPDYKEKITADNLFLKTQSVAEIGFFPGSTQKKDFIGAISRNMFIKLTKDKIPWVKLVTGVEKSLSEKHFLMYFHNKAVQRLIEDAGWGGRIASLSCQDDNCLSDYLMIVEANLGVNKANFLVERKGKLEINNNNDKLQHKLTLTYSNESNDKAFPGGEYFSYTRVLLPRETVVEKVTVGEMALSRDDITVSDYQEKVMLGFPMRIPASSVKDVIISYYLKNSQNKLDTNIELLVQKQPGINPFPLQIIHNDQQAVKDLEVINDHLVSLSTKSKTSGQQDQQ